MNYNLEIQKILLQIDSLKNPEDKISEIKRAINLADANNDIDWGYDLREMLIRIDGLLISRDESFPAFTWILNTADTNPNMFDEQDILGEYLWMASIAFCNASISKEQVDYITNDFRRRLNTAGFSDRSYYELLIDWYLFVGDAEKARESLILRGKEPFDELSSVNEKMTEICVELLSGNLDKGITMSNEFAAANADNPSNIFSIYNQLIYYLNNARDKRANQFFDKVDELFSKKEKYPYLLFDLCLMMYYMSRNEKEKAWVYFENYAGWEVGANDYSSFDFSLAVLPLLRGAGKREMQLSPHLPYYRPDNTYDCEELYNYYYAKSMELAQKFDSRDGNSYFNEQIKRHLTE